MFKKLKIILVLASLSVSLCLMSNTYSRYVADTTGNIDMLFAKWQILVNNNNITNNTSSSITFTPVMEENVNVASNVIAPSSKGYFDIEIDPSNVDVSFKYTISLIINNEDVPDLMLTKYAIIPESYIEGNSLTKISLTNNLITNNLIYDNSINNFQFTSFTIRVYFEWYEGQNEEMDNSEDTAIGTFTNNVAIDMSASISFEQIIN